MAGNGKPTYTDRLKGIIDIVLMIQLSLRRAKTFADWVWHLSYIGQLCTFFASLSSTLYYPTSSLGGRVSVPLDGNENTRLTSLSQQYYYECEADTQSGKTAWIGIKPSEQNERQWVVSFNFQYQIHVYLVVAWLVVVEFIVFDTFILIFDYVMQFFT